MWWDVVRDIFLVRIIGNCFRDFFKIIALFFKKKFTETEIERTSIEVIIRLPQCIDTLT